MIDASKITAALEAQFNADATMQDAIIERCEYVNQQETRVPWLGIYRTRVKYTPRTLGRHTETWQGQIYITLLLQEASSSSGAEAEERLEAFIKRTLTSIWADPTLGGQLEMVVDMDVSYIEESTNEDSLYFQTAMIEIIGEVRTG